MDISSYIDSLAAKGRYHFSTKEAVVALSSSAVATRAAIRRLREKGWLGLVAPNASVRRLLEIVGVFADPSFRVFDDRPAAEAALLDGTSAG